MKTTKRILVLLCLMVVTMGAWADPAWKIRQGTTGDWVDMTILETPKDYNGQAYYTTGVLTAGNYTYYVRYYADGVTDIDTYTAQVTGGLSFTLSEASTVTFNCRHKGSDNWLSCVTNVRTYQVANSGWEIMSTLYSSPGSAETVNYFNYATDFNVGTIILEGTDLKNTSNTHIALYGGDKRVLGPITLTNNSVVGVNKATLNYATATMTYEPVTTLPVTITSAGASTLVLPAQATIPEGVKAYKLKYEDSKLKAEELTSTIPANTPVLLNANPGTYDFDMGKNAVVYKTTSETIGGKTKYYIKDVNRDENFIDANNVLVGVMQPHYVPTNSYVLSNGSQGVGFYKVTASNVVIQPFRAYVTVPAASAHSLEIVFDQGTTGITAVSAERHDNVVYNLSGQRVGNDFRGIVVKNGRKYIQK